MAIDINTLNIGTAIFNTGTPEPQPQPLPYFRYDDDKYIVGREEEYDIPSSVTDNYAKGMDRQALNKACSDLIEFKSSSITYLDDKPFVGCTSLQTLELSSITTDGFKNKGEGVFAISSLLILKLTSIHSSVVDRGRWGIPDQCTIICKDGTLHPVI